MENEEDLDARLAEATATLSRAKSALETARADHDVAAAAVRTLTKRIALRDQLREKAIEKDRLHAARSKHQTEQIRVLAARSVAEMRDNAAHVAALCRADADAGGSGCPSDVLRSFSPAQVSAIRACATDQEAAALSGLFVAHARFVRERRTGYALRDLSSPPPKQRGRPSTLSDDDVRRLRSLPPGVLEAEAQALGISLAYARQIRYRSVRTEVPDDPSSKGVMAQAIMEALCKASAETS